MNECVIFDKYYYCIVLSSHCYRSKIDNFATCNTGVKCCIRFHDEDDNDILTIGMTQSGQHKIMYPHIAIWYIIYFVILINYGV